MKMKKKTLWEKVLDKKPKAPIVNKQKRILSRLMYTPVMTFNQLWDKDGESNKFAYHLKKLETDGLVKKTMKGYRLTRKGKKYTAYLKAETGEDWRPPLVCVALLVIDDKKKKVLMLQRSKEPFHGYCGFHGGKISSSEYIFESAQKSLREDIGLSCDLELKGLFSSKTLENEEVSYGHQLFVVKASNPKGKLIKTMRKGTNKWIDIDKIAKQNIFPNSPLLLKIALSKKFRWIEADRFQENGLFVGIDVKKEMSF